MRLNTATIVILVVLGIVAATMKVVATIKVSRCANLPRAARIVFVLRTIFLFVLVAVGLARFFLPPVWQFSIFGTTTFITLIGILVVLWMAYPLLIWKGQKAESQDERVARAR
ncbi:MAG: hypothetical protein WBE20_08725 [Candidatus Acidiferrales bacterium]